MNKTELVNYVAEVSHITKVDATRAVDTVFKGIMESLSNKNDCQFIGFGSFKLRKRNARQGRDPRSGKEIKIPASTTVGFSPSKQLKELLSK